MVGLPTSPLIPSRDSDLLSQGIICLSNDILRPHLSPLSGSPMLHSSMGTTWNTVQREVGG